MDILALIAAFGGGVMGAYLGAVPAFIMTGVLAFVGAIAGMLGLDAGTFIVGQLAFGCFMGPHVSFAGGVAAAAYAGKKKELASGADVASALNGLGSPDVLIVGGVFGMLGYVLRWVVSIIPFLNNATDQPGIIVFTLGVVARLVFGSTGLTGKYTGKEPRQYVASGKSMTYNIVLGAGIGIAVSFIAASVKTTLPAEFWGPFTGNFAVLCFGFAAITLFFTVMGLATPGTHHIILPAAAAAIIGINAFGPVGCLFGVIIGITNSIIGDFAGRTFNSYCDSHIDPPAFTIFTTMIIINCIGAALGVVNLF